MTKNRRPERAREGGEAAQAIGEQERPFGRLLSHREPGDDEEGSRLNPAVFQGGGTMLQSIMLRNFLSTAPRVWKSLLER